MPTYMEVEARGWDNHRKVAHAADGFSSEHRDWDKDLQYGVQGGGNRVAPPGPTYFTGISMKAGSLKRRSAAFREFAAELRESLGKDLNRICFLDGSNDITVIYYNRP